MNMILVHLQFLNLKSVMPHNLAKQFPTRCRIAPCNTHFRYLGAHTR